MEPKKFAFVLAPAPRVISVKETRENPWASSYQKKKRLDYFIKRRGMSCDIFVIKYNALSIIIYSIENFVFINTTAWDLSKCPASVDYWFLCSRTYIFSLPFSTKSHTVRINPVKFNFVYRFFLETYSRGPSTSSKAWKVYQRLMAWIVFCVEKSNTKIIYFGGHILKLNFLQSRTICLTTIPSTLDFIEKFSLSDIGSYKLNHVEKFSELLHLLHEENIIPTYV